MLTKTKIQPRLTLIGAGPGDPELLTIKGARALAEADVILYDALVNLSLLDYAPQNAIKIYVGKRADNHRYKQHEIHSLILQYARNHGHVVRLKGGDPYVFGRGHEEKIFAEAHGIVTEVIPGISSSIAVAGLQGIPVTKRGVNESFWVTTGTTRNGKLSDDVKLAARSNSTIVILMGMNKLKEIAEVFIKSGKKKTPFAIIQNGSLPGEKTGFGEIHELEQVAYREKLSSPAIIVIGEVVREHAFFRKQLLEEYYFKSHLSQN